ncbi:hypothetical protein QBC35DRAFT_440157 [Podospora australis]|uniref:F-box domain-containing protein n=1 Tax=Podospora australis TaxID=1536484 RepID=A0AAN6WN03_9PEZI|nr:hypothetical protein QBC35DRAFT_440157 [Podospora australis]
MDLLTCDADVLFMIRDYLAKGDLISLCLVRSNLRTLAEPALYSRVDFNCSDRPSPSEQTQIFRRLSKLLRSIVRRPELAAHIRSFECRWSFRHSLDYKTAWTNVDPDTEAKEAAISFVQKQQAPYRETWVQQLDDGIVDAYVAILLSHPLPRLRFLSLSHDFFRQSDLIGHVLESILCRPRTRPPTSSLLLLECVELYLWVNSYANDHDRRNTANILPFLYLPNLQRLQAAIDTPITKTLTWPAPFTPVAFRLRSVQVRNLRESHLAQLLSVPERLRSLEWHWYYNPGLDNEFNSPVINVDLIMPALSRHKHALTELCLQADFHRRYYDPPYPFRVQGSPRALRGFNQLKMLTIPLVYLVGFAPFSIKWAIRDCLPPNLEDLALTSELLTRNQPDMRDEETFDELSYTRKLRPWLADDVKQFTPRLEKIDLFLTEEEPRVPDHIGCREVAMREELCELAEAAGILLRVCDIRRIRERSISTS